METTERRLMMPVELSEAFSSLLMTEEMKMANELMRANEAVHLLCGEEYPEKIQPVKDVITQAMQQGGKDVLPACIDLLTTIKDEQNAGVQTMWFLAAAVDLINEQKAANAVQRVVDMFKSIV